MNSIQFLLIRDSHPPDGDVCSQYVLYEAGHGYAAFKVASRDAWSGVDERRLSGQAKLRYERSSAGIGRWSELALSPGDRASSAPAAEPSGSAI